MTGVSAPTNHGFLLDVSRNRVPRTEELLRLVDLLAALGYDQLQLYLEHAFAYEGHEVVWRGRDPLRPEEVGRLAAHGAEKGVELVPCQNSFGHFHRWLVHEPYRELAECPDGVEHPFSPDPEPFSLCPTDPRSLELLEDLYAQLLPCFDARPAAADGPPLFNTGLDETLDLGRGRSKELCEERGKTTVYLDFLRQVRDLVARHGRRMLFWGDVILEDPERVSEIPGDAVALLWGYEAGHPFGRGASILAGAGLDFWICPGTSSWNSFGGRIANLLANVRRAHRVAGRPAEGQGAGGVLLTDWGDNGHLQPPPVSWPGLVAGAAARRGEPLGRDDLPDALVRQVPEMPDRRVAEALVELGEIEELTGGAAQNGSALFFAVLKADRSPEERRGEGLTIEGLDRAAERLDEIDARLRGDTLVERELRWVGAALRLGVDVSRARLGIGEERPLSELPADVRRRLAADRERLLEALDPIWLARSRRGGSEASKGLVRRALAGLDE